MRHGQWHQNKHDRWNAPCRRWCAHWCVAFGHEDLRNHTARTPRTNGQCDCRDDGGDRGRTHPPTGGAPAERPARRKAVRAVGRRQFEDA
jgi:hypothetical protein